jgi:3-deoxy-D-manno-octulosonate 8-phosphate phosphatase (KDO 8-P phosphatase)
MRGERPGGQHVSTSVLARARRIRLVLLDVDGVLTDGRIAVDARGRELRTVHARDVTGIALLRHAGIRVALLTDRRGAATGVARVVGVDAVVERVTTGVAAARRLCRRWRVAPQELAFVGDDVLDQPLAALAGLAVSVADGARGLGRSVHWTTRAAGGAGAVREVAEQVLRAQGKWASVLGERMR